MFSSFSGMRATDKGLNVLDSILPELLSSLDRHQDSGLESRVTYRYRYSAESYCNSWIVLVPLRLPVVSCRLAAGARGNQRFDING